MTGQFERVRQLAVAIHLESDESLLSTIQVTVVSFRVSDRSLFCVAGCGYCTGAIWKMTTLSGAHFSYMKCVCVSVCVCVCVSVCVTFYQNFFIFYSHDHIMIWQHQYLFHSLSTLAKKFHTSFHDFVWS